MSNKIINNGATVINLLKQDANTAILEGQWVFERANGKFELATNTVPVRTRAWLVYRNSPAGCSSVAVVLSGYGRALFATPAALNSYTALQLNATLTGGNFTLNGAGTITDYVTPVAGSIVSNRLSDLQELVCPGNYELDKGNIYASVLIR